MTTSTDPVIGRLIDGRYEVRSRIARGGMATVYLATDLRLERRVALKAMHGHLADDSAFRERFIQEARSAARLAHPNVVNVFDQGQDDDLAYLVMEYLPGITLRELLNDYSELTTEQTLDVTEAVLSGLAAAHRAGIVHRDLKPENVLLADDGRIKIGDFGLARAASANTATGAALLGTVAYLSPELVTRGVADTRSDIYAVGIMMYEMLTGEQPFKGEQPMQIAYQHANDSVPPPSDVNKKVSVDLDELVLWATARDPEHRPRDAKELLDRVLEVRGTVAPGRTAVQRTLVLPSDAARHDDETQILTPTGSIRSGSGPVPSVAETLATKTRARRRRGAWLFALVIALAAFAGGAGWYFGTGPGSQVAVPDVSGESPEAARERIEDLGFTVASATESAYHRDIDEGLVVGTDPATDAVVQKNTPVTLVISDGPEPLPLPELVGRPLAEVEEAVEDTFVIGDDIDYRFAEEAENTVLAATGRIDGEPVDLAGADTYLDGRTIDLVVSLGPVPNVVGESFETAVERLEVAGLTAQRGAQQYDDSVPEGAVIAQHTGESPVRRGDTVELVVSRGPAPVTIPDVIGESLNEAAQTIRDAGLEAVPNSSLPEAFWGVVAVESMSPGAGESVLPGTSVTLNGDF